MIQVVSDKTIVYRISRVIFGVNVESTNPPPPDIYFETTSGHVVENGTFVSASMTPVNVPADDVTAIIDVAPPPELTRNQDWHRVLMQYAIDHAVITGIIQEY